jgi:hypothetical protein
VPALPSSKPRLKRSRQEPPQIRNQSQDRKQAPPRTALDYILEDRRQIVKEADFLRESS